MVAVDGQAILQYALWSDPGALDDIRGLARRAYPHDDISAAMDRVADFFARYPHIWTDMEPMVPVPSPADDTRTPTDYVVRMKAFERRWAARVDGRGLGLNQEQCWGTMQDELAWRIGYEIRTGIAGIPEADDAQGNMQQGLTD